MISCPVTVDVSGETDRGHEIGTMMGKMLGTAVDWSEDNGNDRTFYYSFETKEAADKAERVIAMLSCSHLSDIAIYTAVTPREP